MDTRVEVIPAVIGTKLDRLFADYTAASTFNKAVLAGKLVRRLRSLHLSRRAASEVGRVETLLAMIDQDHIIDLDDEVAELRLEIDRALAGN